MRSAVGHYRKRHRHADAARGRSLGLLFFNPSLRTRTSMELAAVQLGAHVTTINVGQGTWGFEWEDGQVMDGDAAEHIREAVGVLSRYYDALGVRVFASGTDYEADKSDHLLTQFAEAADVPVINLESAFYHPCQALGDAATLNVQFEGEVVGRKFVLAWAYHPKALPMAVPNSAVITASRLGMNVIVARPEGYALDEDVMGLARRYANSTGGSVDETDDLEEAVSGAHVIYAKAWGGPLSYSDPDRERSLRSSLRGWRIRGSHFAQPHPPVFMHCLPVRRNVVVDDAVLDGPHAIHLLQAEFRLHAQKAVLELVWGL